MTYNFARQNHGGRGFHVAESEKDPSLSDGPDLLHTDAGAEQVRIPCLTRSLPVNRSREFLDTVSHVN